MEQYNGYEVKTEGDSFMVAFKKAATAIRFCQEVQESLLTEVWPEELLTQPACKEEIHDETGVLLFKGLRVR